MPGPDEIRLQVWVPAWLYDACSRAASGEGVTLSAWVRELLERVTSAVHL